ncbi:Thioredoxin-1 [Candidatus Annandia adelgestsuga]|uniref:Thioredoxin n=1 Tax=Candidatus Annandia adelgestsuga TaxID=1302411 RepID=A0A3S5HNW1_9ENTR|nr:thioredoxin domain-containing protein [Candidatus Annandia adelgestsuga]AZP36188.1 Thioredoxin-1 [Candidatus Annandia adelgestsuga]
MSKKNKNIINVENDNIDIILKKSNKLILLDFWASWCNPCKIQLSIIEEIYIEYYKKIEIYKINIDYNKNTVLKYNIKSIPTIFFFKCKKLLYKTNGIKNKKDLCNLINKFSEF